MRASANPCTQKIANTILDEVSIGHIKSYEMGGDSGLCYCSIRYPYPCHFINNSGWHSFNDTEYSLAPLSFIPERYPFNKKCVFYFPNDITNCFKAPGYLITPFRYNVGLENVTIFDLLGNVYQHQNIVDKQTIIDISTYPSGVYLLRINGVFYKKFVKL